MALLSTPRGITALDMAGEVIKVFETPSAVSKIAAASNAFAYLSEKEAFLRTPSDFRSLFVGGVVASVGSEKLLTITDKVRFLFATLFRNFGIIFNKFAYLA